MNVGFALTVAEQRHEVDEAGMGIGVSDRQMDIRRNAGASGRQQTDLMLEKQEKMTLQKIYAQMQKEKGKKENVRLFGRRKALILIAAAVMMLGMVVFAREADWDIKMAEMLGLSNVMEDLEGGYVRIGTSAQSDGVTVTATQAIGDRNSQWIQFDTDLPWEEGKYYLFGEEEAGFYTQGDIMVSAGCTLVSYNQDGCVSFLLYAVDCNKINRARVKVHFAEIYEYEDGNDEEGKLVSSGEWNLEWSNCYAANTITRHPYRNITLEATDGTEFSCILHKIEISPVSIRIEAWKHPGTGNAENSLVRMDSITLQDGTVISCDEWTCAGSRDNWALETFYSFADIEHVNMNNIAYITVGGRDIRIQKGK